MDIELGSEGPDGIEAVRRLVPADRSTQVIYLTGHAEYCTRVYRTEHVYFLVKPVDQKDFNDAVDKAVANIEAMASTPFAVKTSSGLARILPQRVSYLESDRRKVRLHLDAEVVETYASLAEFSRKLPSSFVQCHKSFLVNMDYVSELRKDSIRLITGETVPVSQKRRKAVRETFLAFLKSRL